METYFDSPERSTLQEVINQSKMFNNNQVIQALINGFPELAVILNKQRQIVECNEKAVTFFKSSNKANILGKRMGEALNCIHSYAMPAGCGTSQFCMECGAANSIKKTQEDLIESLEECRIIAEVDGKEISLDLLVNTRPFEFDNTSFTLFAIRDISDEKRRENLERIFFHDVLNTASAVNGLANLLIESESEQDRIELGAALIDSSNQLLNEIIAQRDIRNAENGVLKTDIKLTSVNSILTKAFEQYSKHELAEGKTFSLILLSHDVNFETDISLLIRSIGNLIKNALEASEKNQAVTISAEIEEGEIQILIKNEKVIPTNIQLNLFQRSYSTKASYGRGLGLYSVKLIVEQYLNGKVSFVSNEQLKTIFMIKLPLKND